HDRHERLREHVPEQSNELVPLARHEALPVLPEGATSHVVDVEEVVGGAADLRAPLLARVDANPRRPQPGEPARHRRGHEIERPDLRAGDRRDVVTRPRLVSEALIGDREHEHEDHEEESHHASTLRRRPSVSYWTLGHWPQYGGLRQDVAATAQHLDRSAALRSM